ncbi:hypothetical protein CTAYLR_000557 [Chrysophaeum taylorii]|uniref:aspartate carbamoyltransferase n=1 Tax=Chrysophaeum taylorii TaxID=2483200 RepID=A0AAD7UJ28_9STRA|nr:hypothetical protein CTAYLR_000557 [Chrysophaeum taylorii]
MLLGGDREAWRGASLLSISQLDREGVELVMRVADNARTESSLLGGKVLCSLFYEPSTRTACSFLAAMLRLGGGTMSLHESTSSAVKGESFEDTIRTVSCYSDVVVLRHPTPGAPRRASEITKTPIINAGDGTGEHPTQALLDVYTLIREIGGIDGKTIALVGDLKHGRTAHSLAKILRLYDVALLFVSPPGLEMPGTQEVVSLEEAVRVADAIYVTRIQRERFEDPGQYDSLKGSYKVDAALMATAKPKCAVLHPLPRVDEISTDFDDDPRAAYFRQMENGMYVRMALLTLILSPPSK